MQRLVCGLLTAGLLVVGAARTHAEDVTKGIIQKAITAHGGAAKLAQLRVRQEKTRSTFEARGLTVTATTDSLVQLPDRRKDTIDNEAGGNKSTSIQVVQGDMAWQRRNGQTTAYPAEQRRWLQERLHGDYVLTLAPLLQDPELTLSALGEVQVNGRQALGVKVSARDRQDVDLYFDKANGLLVKSGGKRFLSRTQEAYVETVYSDYQETDGLTWPRKAVDYLEGIKKVQETELTELRFLDKIDAGEFAQP
jgi:hypothetical protein